MISDEKLEANRLNAQKSTGPRTAEGKARSALNAVKHGGLAKSVCLRSESTDRFRDLVDQFHREYNPRTPTETTLVGTMASVRWRLLRLGHLEATNVDLEYARTCGQVPEIIPADFDNADRTGIAYHGVLANSRVLEYVARRESRLLQQFEKCVKMLRTLQAGQRKAWENHEGLVPPPPTFEYREQIEHLETNPPADTQ